MRLEVDTDRLGSLRLDVKSRGREVTATIAATEPATVQALAAQGLALSLALASGGARLASYEVLGHGTGHDRGRRDASAEPQEPLPRPARTPRPEGHRVWQVGAIDCLV